MLFFRKKDSLPRDELGSGLRPVLPCTAGCRTKSKPGTLTQGETQKTVSSVIKALLSVAASPPHTHTSCVWFLQERLKAIPRERGAKKRSIDRQSSPSPPTTSMAGLRIPTDFLPPVVLPVAQKSNRLTSTGQPIASSGPWNFSPRLRALKNQYNKESRTSSCSLTQAANYPRHIINKIR